MFKKRLLVVFIFTVFQQDSDLKIRTLVNSIMTQYLEDYKDKLGRSINYVNNKFPITNINIIFGKYYQIKDIPCFQLEH